jgi:6-pyruvoyltetrahydropterin/6-carboxytetrahydropterin synthase
MGRQFTTLTKVYEFSAAHRLHSPRLSDQQNRLIFGKCNNPNGHGHNYSLEVTVTGPIDQETGMIVDLTRLDRWVHKVIDPLDHTWIDKGNDYFIERPSTGENIVNYLWNELTPLVALEAELERLLLRETSGNFFEVVKN